MPASKRWQEVATRYASAWKGITKVMIDQYKKDNTFGDNDDDDDNDEDNHHDDDDDEQDNDEKQPANSIRSFHPSPSSDDDEKMDANDNDNDNDDGKDPAVSDDHGNDDTTREANHNQFVSQLCEKTLTGNSQYNG
jgi:hypothetical protein